MHNSLVFTQINAKYCMSSNSEGEQTLLMTQVREKLSEWLSIDRVIKKTNVNTNIHSLQPW